MYDMRVLRFASLLFVDPAFDAVLFLLTLAIFKPGVLCRSDVPNFRFASMHSVDPAFDAVSFLLTFNISSPDTFFPSSMQVLQYASLRFVDLAYRTVLCLLSRVSFGSDTLFPSDVLVRRLASLSFIDPASDAVSLLLTLAICRPLALSTEPLDDSPLERTHTGPQHIRLTDCDLSALVRRRVEALSRGPGGCVKTLPF